MSQTKRWAIYCRCGVHVISSALVMRVEDLG